VSLTATQLRQRIRLYYFSGTGNTRWAAERFADAAEEAGAHVALVPIVDDMELPDRHDDTDVVGIAHPIYGADVPPIVKRFYERLAACCPFDAVPPSIFVLTTFGFVDALGPRYEEKQMAGLRIRWYRGVHLVNNVTTPRRPAPIPDEQVAERRKERARSAIEELAWDVVSGIDRSPAVRITRLAGPVVRRITQEAVSSHYSRIGVDRDRCVLCKLCMEQCPTGSITYTERRFHVSETCTACMRCYNFCPVHAITVDGQYADPSLYPRHRGL
jgi:NAD-dependent dihydropyrimidine dehydrogenase PreA subunit